MLFDAVIGAGVGVFVRVWANALGKNRYFARKIFCCHSCVDFFFFCVIITYLFSHIIQSPTIGPWNHVFLAGIGGYIGYNYMAWQNQLLIGVNNKRKARGMPEIAREDVMGSWQSISKLIKNEEQ